MENTLENARKFLEPNESCQNTLHWSPEVLEFMSKKLVAYAATIRPAAEVVVRVPSERKNLELMQWEKGYNSGWNNCISELRRLNPTLTFSEETK